MRNKNSTLGAMAAGGAAGAVNGLLSAGGGMVLAPMLSGPAKVAQDKLFPTTVAVILPLCLVSLGVYALHDPLPWAEALPYCLGAGVGGCLAGLFGRKIPVAWLHRGLGLLILWAGIRYLLT